jgi:hypothetical protein
MLGDEGAILAAPSRPSLRESVDGTDHRREIAIGILVMDGDPVQVPGCDGSAQEQRERQGPGHRDKASNQAPDPLS